MFSKRLSKVAYYDDPPGSRAIWNSIGVFPSFETGVKNGSGVYSPHTRSIVSYITKSIKEVNMKFTDFNIQASFVDIIDDTNYRDAWKCSECRLFSE
jgi:hypothetical protein